MISDAALARIALAVYSDPLPPGEWCGEWRKDGAWVATWREGDVDIVAFRGSKTPLDWMEDAVSCRPVWDRELGHCGAGFLIGMRAVQDTLDGVIGKRVIVTGHSLGAAHALLYAAHRCAAGLPPMATVVFGSPRPGFARVRDLLKGVPVRSYRNRHDPVTEVPKLGVGEFDLFMHPRPLIAVDASPVPHDPLGLFADHRMELYAKALAALEAAQPALV